ncbi:MAG: phosphatase PAP2 family protein [bacterium]|nr:phosphatase PAP2 family protein [bacterium]
MLRKILTDFWEKVPAKNWIWIPPLLFGLSALIIYISDTNRSLFLLINSYNNQQLDIFWANINILGDAFFAVVIQLLWIRRRPDIVWTSVFASFPAFLISHGIKDLLSIPRPPGVLSTEIIHVIGPVFTQNAFPSGHATTVFTIAAVWILSIRSVRLRYLILVPGLLIGYSRICAGVHWPVDIMGGAVAGWLSACIGIMLYSVFKWCRKPVSWNVLTILLIIAGAVLLIQYDTGFEQAEIFHRILAAVCVLLGLFNLIRGLKDPHEVKT